jgi:hypothetical protein
MRRTVLIYAIADAAYHLAVKPRLRKSLGIKAHPTTSISYDSFGRVIWR